MKSLKRTSKREVVKQGIKRLIAEENLAPGDQILSQNQLAKRFDVNPLTAHKAMTELCEANILYRENGRGTFVGPRPTNSLNIALALPGEHLESADANPDFWPFVSHISNIFIRTVGRNGCFSTISIAENELETIDLNRLRQFDMLFSLGIADFRILAKRLSDTRTAVPVLFEPPIDGLNAIHVDNDRKEAVKLGVLELLMSGYRKIGLFCTKSDWGKPDIEGYKEAHTDFGLSMDPKLIFQGFSVRKDGAKAAALLMSEGMPCDAIFADTDLLALGMIERFESEGVKVPGDIGVMGYHGLDLATSLPPYLTSVAIPYNEMITWSLSAFKEMKGEMKTVSKLDFPGRLINGKTIAKGG